MFVNNNIFYYQRENTRFHGQGLILIKIIYVDINAHTLKKSN